jgi:GT2 family glycosyltransferase
MPLPVAVIVPTCNRPGLFKDRCLASIGTQTRRPDLVLIVDDSKPEHRAANRSAVEAWDNGSRRAIYLENARTRGAAGAWNTGLYHLHEVLPTCWVALLDDDDEWEPEYLEVCATAGEGRQADVVVAGIVRRTGQGPDQRLTVPGCDLLPRDFLTGNPHWQGSNTFARLDALLAAGCFDESFSSTNDRDLGLRLLDLSWLRWCFIDDHLVVHHANPGTPRLSSRSSECKKLGLQAFYRKYRGRMSEEDAQAFFRRSESLFGVKKHVIEAPWRPAVQAVASSSTPPVSEILIGTISSPNESIASEFLRGLLRLGQQHPETQIEVAVLLNGGNVRIERGPLEQSLAALEEFGIHCHLLATNVARRLSIAEARTQLQVSCYEILRGRQIPVWLLDDDVRFDVLLETDDGIDWSHDSDPLRKISELKGTGADVVIGSVTGDPPLPHPSTMRVQAVDLLHNLEWMAGLASRSGTSHSLPSRHAENAELRQRYRDYYYDLSRDSGGHLEQPFWYEPLEPGAAVGTAFREMISRLQGILAGRQVFRPLVWTPHTQSENAEVEFFRGPNTLVFRPECLVELPNLAPRLGGVPTRRSDMMWSLLGYHALGWRVISAEFPVRQDRSIARPSRHPDWGPLVHDVRGSAVFLALLDHVRQRESTRSSGRIFAFSAEEQAQLVKSAARHMRSRVIAQEVSCHRIRALARVLLRCATGAARGHSRHRLFWLDDDAFSRERDLLATFASRLESEVAARSEQWASTVADYERSDLLRFFGSLDGLLTPPRSGGGEQQA